MSVFFRHRTLRARNALLKKAERGFEIAGYAAIVMFATHSFVFWFSAQDAIRLQRIEISGVRTELVERIEKTISDRLSQPLLFRIERMNAFFIPEDALATAIRTLDPRIRSVDISVHDMAVLRVDIVQYVPAYLYCAHGDPEIPEAITCYYADKEGYVFSSAPDYSNAPYLVFEHEEILGEGPIGIGAYIENRDLLNTTMRFAERAALEGLSFRRIEFLATGDIAYYPDLGPTVIWSPGKDVEESATQLRIALRTLREETNKDIESIDLRFGQKVFYREEKEEGSAPEIGTEE